MPWTHPPKRKTALYTEEQLQGAIKAVTGIVRFLHQFLHFVIGLLCCIVLRYLTDKVLFLDGMSVREAAEAYSIPRSTLGDKMRGKSQPCITNRGNKPVLGKLVEDRLVFYFRTAF